MDIAVFEGQKFQFIKGKKENRITLVSNVWQEGFDEAHKETEYYYAKEIMQEEADSICRYYISLNIEGFGNYEVQCGENPKGDVLIFENEQGLADLLDDLCEPINENLYQILCQRLSTKYDYVLEVVKEDIYDGSQYRKRENMIHLIGFSLQLAKLSARDEVLSCRSCGYTFPFRNVSVKFGETYQVKCPRCGNLHMKKRF